MRTAAGIACFGGRVRWLTLRRKAPVRIRVVPLVRAVCRLRLRRGAVCRLRLRRGVEAAVWGTTKRCSCVRAAAKLDRLRVGAHDNADPLELRLNAFGLFVVVLRGDE